MSEIGPTEIVDALASLESHALDIFPQQCVRARHRKAGCTLCADHCPTGAIAWDEPMPINPALCIGCGLCAAVCPTGAIEATSPTNVELLQQIEEFAKTTWLIAVACPQVAGNDATGVIRVPCLGRVDASVLLGAVAADVKRIEMVDAECSSCPNNLGHAIAAQAIDEANSLLQACGIAPRIAFVAQSDLLNQPVSTTNAKAISGEKIRATKSPIVKGELPVRVPTKRQLVLSSLQRLAPQVANVELETTEWATVSVKPSCTGCQMCAFFCPTGALVKISDAGKPSLIFQVANCTACHLCQDACYTQSIELGARVNLNNVVAQASEAVWSNTQTCSRDEKLKRLRMFK